MSSFMVGRQPIFNAKHAVRGYELLFREPSSPRPGGDAMTADVLVHAGLDLGLEKVVGSKRAFVNVTRPYLAGELEVPFSARQVVLEVLEDVPRDDEVVSGCRRLVTAGYTLALDDYLAGYDDDPLLELVSIVKLDVLQLRGKALDEAVARCSGYGAELVAEKVETPGQFQACQELGFDLYQGYLLSRPEVVPGRSLSASQATCARLLVKLSDPTTSFGEVERIVQTDASLSYRFLRAAGAGAARGLYRRVRSVRDALVLLGERRMRAWVALALLAGEHEGPEEHFNIAMSRARMAEEMAMSLAPVLVDNAFTVGLVSALDVLLGVSLAEVVTSLSLVPGLEAALLGHSGLLGAILSDVLSWELGGGPGLRLRSGLSARQVEGCYLRALAWATEACDVLDLAGA
jgi:EAL and modified HD-GYP domain-containing signal transduction protein